MGRWHICLTETRDTWLPLPGEGFMVQTLLGIFVTSSYGSKNGWAPERPFNSFSDFKQYIFNLLFLKGFIFGK